MAVAKVDLVSYEELLCIVKDSHSLQEVLQKIGYSSCSGENRKTVLRRIEKYGINTEHFRFGIGKRGILRTIDNTLCENSTAVQSVLRRVYTNASYTEYECSICGLPPLWNGKPLTLTLDHINGDNKNNSKDNLRWVCPNCDRQLPTFGSKNRRVF